MKKLLFILIVFPVILKAQWSTTSVGVKYKLNRDSTSLTILDASMNDTIQCTRIMYVTSTGTTTKIENVKYIVRTLVNGSYQFYNDSGTLREVLMYKSKNNGNWLML